MYWHGTRTCPLHTNTSLSCTGTVQERVPYTPIHHCHVLARYKNVSLTHQYITVMYWHGTRTCPLPTNTSLSCTGTVQERVPYTPIHHSHVLARYKNVSLTHQYITVMYWHGTRTCPLHTNTSLSCTGTVQERVPYTPIHHCHVLARYKNVSLTHQYITVMYWHGTRTCPLHTNTSLSCTGTVQERVHYTPIHHCHVLARYKNVSLTHQYITVMYWHGRRTCPLHTNTSLSCTGTVQERVPYTPIHHCHALARYKNVSLTHQYITVMYWYGTRTCPLHTNTSLLCTGTVQERVPYTPIHHCHVLGLIRYKNVSLTHQYITVMYWHGTRTCPLHTNISLSCTGTLQERVPYTPIHHCHVLARYKNLSLTHQYITVMYWHGTRTCPLHTNTSLSFTGTYKDISFTHQYITVMYWHGTRTCPLHTNTSLSCTDTVQERVPYTPMHHCHVLAWYKNVSLTHQYNTVMYWHGTRTCPLHTNTSLSCTGTVQERVPYTPIHHCHVLARYKNVSLTHQYITVMYWHGTRTCPLHTNTSLSCTGTVQERVPYTPIHHCHVLARYKNVSLTHQCITVMYWHGTRTCPLHTNTSLSCTGTVQERVPYTPIHHCHVLARTRTCLLHTNTSLSCTGTVQERVPYTPIHHCHVLARYKNVSLTHQYITVMYWHDTITCPLHTNTSLSCTGTVQERVHYTPIHHCHVLARYKNVSLTHQYITVMYWHGRRTCPLHTNTSLTCTGTVQERVPYTPIHHCHVLARYKNVSLTHQYITVMYWHGTRTCPLHTNTSLSCTGTVQERVPYPPIHHCHVLARYKNVSLTHQYITLMYWHGTRTCPLHTNTSLSCTGMVQERVLYTPIHHCHVLARYKNVSLTHQYITVMYWHDTRTCPLHTNTSLSCTGMVQERVPYTPIHHCHVLARYKNVSITHQYITVMYWHGTRTCPLHTNTSLSCTGTVEERVPYTPIHHCHVLARYKNVSLTHQYITVMYWHGTRTCPLHTNTSLSCTGTVQERVPYTPIHHCHVLARYKNVSLTHQFITVMYWHGTKTCPLDTNTSLSCTGTVQERVPYTPIHHCHVLARYKNVSLTHQYITVMYWHDTRTCPLHTNTSLSCTGTVQERVPYTPIHHCRVLARYKNVSLTHQFITVVYWHGTRTCPLHTNTSLSCTATVQERVPYTPIHHCHVLARYKNVSLTHQYITVMYWHGTRTCPLHTNTSLSCTGTVQERVPYIAIHHYHVLTRYKNVSLTHQYITVMYWHGTRTCPLHPNTSLSCTGTVQERVPYTPIHHCHVLARYKNVSLTPQYITVMYWHGTRTCPLHTNTSLSCTGTVQERVPYTPIHHCHVLARYNNVSLTHQYITVMYWHGTRTCPLHTTTSLSCTGMVQERVP